MDGATEAPPAPDAVVAEVLVDHLADGVALLSLNRPHVLNAVTPSLARAYAAAMRRLDADPAVRAIVITGAGRGFCAGADLALLSGDLDPLRQAVPARADLPGPHLARHTPVVAAVNGPVAGIGLAYLLGSDVRFADPLASIGTSFARLGLVAEYGLSWVLPRLIGLGRATEWLLSGRPISGREAYDMGLVQYVSPPGAVLEEAIAYATELGQRCSPWSIAVIKSQLAADQECDYEAALTRALTLMDESFGRDELRVALAARQRSRAST